MQFFHTLWSSMHSITQINGCFTPLSVFQPLISVVTKKRWGFWHFIISALWLGTVTEIHPAIYCTHISEPLFFMNFSFLCGVAFRWYNTYCYPRNVSYLFSTAKICGRDLAKVTVHTDFRFSLVVDWGVNWHLLYWPDLVWRVKKKMQHELCGWLFRI